MKILLGILILISVTIFTIIVCILAAHKKEIWESIEFKEEEMNDFKITKEAPTFEELKKEMKSEIIIGDVHCYTKAKFNWFNRLMMKLVFGWEVRKL